MATRVALTAACIVAWFDAAVAPAFGVSVGDWAVFVGCACGVLPPESGLTGGMAAMVALTAFCTSSCCAVAACWAVTVVCWAGGGVGVKVATDVELSAIPLVEVFVAGCWLCIKRVPAQKPAIATMSASETPRIIERFAVTIHHPAKFTSKIYR